MKTETKMSIYIIGCCIVGLSSGYSREITGVEKWHTVVGLLVFNLIWWIAFFHKKPKP